MSHWCGSHWCSVVLEVDSRMPRLWNTCRCESQVSNQCRIGFCVTRESCEWITTELDCAHQHGEAGCVDWGACMLVERLSHASNFFEADILTNRLIPNDNTNFFD